MKNALKLGTFFGIPIAIHWTFILILIFFAWRGMSNDLNPTEISLLLVFILTLFLCVVLHELGHALTARRFGIKTHSIVLLPIGGVASLEKMPEKPSQELMVALAGPAVNVVIALILYPFTDYTYFTETINPNPEDPTQMVMFKASSTFFVTYLFVVNIVLIIFNLLPAFPMDGGRVFRALLSFAMPAHKATRIAATFGQIIAVGFILIGLFSAPFNPLIVIIGLFIFLGAKSESDFKQKEFFMKGFTVKDVMLKEYGTLQKNASIQEAVEMLLKGQSSEFIVLNNGEYVGVLGRDALIQSIKTQSKEESVGSIMKYAEPLSPNQALKDVFANAAKSDVKIWPVMQDGKLIGALDYENITEFLMIRSALDTA